MDIKDTIYYKIGNYTYTMRCNIVSIKRERNAIAKYEIYKVIYVINDYDENLILAVWIGGYGTGLVFDDDKWIMVDVDGHLDYMAAEIYLHNRYVDSVLSYK